MIVDFIKELEAIENIQSYNEYKECVHKLLKKHGYVFFGAGSYCNVYSNKKSFHVIKITKLANCRFFSREEYEAHKEYLIPRYVSKNRFLAIQRKAITSESIRNKLVEIDKEVSESIKKIIVEAKTNKKTLQLLSNKISVRKIPGTGIIPDLHKDNIGMIDGKVLVIDLNNQYDSL